MTVDVAQWLTGAMAAFDTETTGVDTKVDRIVTATCVYLGAGGIGRDMSWLIWPGIDIPERATAIHGITSHHARTHGEAPEHAVPAIAAELMGAWVGGLPVVAMNASFDLSLVQAELERCGHPPLQLGPVLDPLAIDRLCDPRRKGKRNLAALAAHYGVKQDGAHSSRGDALTAARIVWKQARLYRDTFSLTLADMQTAQADAHREWATEFEAYLRRQGKNDVIEREWPLRKGAA